MSYPVSFEVDRPQTYDRVHVLIRLLILVVLCALGGAIGWAFGLIYLAIPLLAAILISQRGAQKYLEESPTQMTRWLGYLVGFYAYLGLLTDRLPVSDEGEKAVRFDVEPGGSPTAGSALLRIILAIPHLIVLAIVGVVALVLAVIAAICVLVSESYPAGIHSFLSGYMRWYARLLAYLASLVDPYPPFSFDGGDRAAELPDATEPAGT